MSSQELAPGFTQVVSAADFPPYPYTESRQSVLSHDNRASFHAPQARKSLLMLSN